MILSSLSSLVFSLLFSCLFSLVFSLLSSLFSLLFSLLSSPCSLLFSFSCLFSLVSDLAISLLHLRSDVVEGVLLPVTHREYSRQGLLQGPQLIGHRGNQDVIHVGGRVLCVVGLLDHVIRKGKHPSHAAPNVGHRHQC